jgi:integrase
MPKIHLTDRFIKTVKHDKRVEYYDGHLIEDGIAKREGVNGLLLRVNPSGKKMFYFYYYHNGANKKVSIGNYPEVGLSEARSNVRDLISIVAKGSDPAREKQKRKTDAPVTLAEYIKRFKNEYVARRLKPSTQKDYISRLDRIAGHKSLSSLPMVDITRYEVREFLKEEARERPTNANRIHSIISKLFNEAVEDRVISDNPIKGMKKLADEKHRDVNYRTEEVRTMWEAMSGEYLSMEGILKMLLVTGQREGETSRMKWKDVDLETRIWRIPASETKNGEAHVVPLSELAMGILRKMKEHPFISDYVFPSLQDQDKPIPDFRTGAKHIQKAIGNDAFRIHDLRHVVATGMIELGVDFIVVGNVLNHKGLSGGPLVTSRYINNDFTPQKRNALDIWGGYLTELITPLKAVKLG